MRQSLNDGLSVLTEFVPKLLLFLVILIVGIIIAKMIAKAVGKLLEKAGFDRAVERGGIKKALERSKFDASDIIGKIIYYALALFVLQLAFGVFGPNPISALLTQVIAFLPSLVVAIVIVVVAAAIAAGVKTLIEGTLGGLSYGRFIANLASAFIVFLGVIAALNQVGVATTVTTPVLVAILATVSGVVIVGAGGGLIKPMQHRWERYLTKAEEEAPRIREHAANAPTAREQAEQARDRYQGDEPGHVGATTAQLHGQPGGGHDQYQYQDQRSGYPQSDPYRQGGGYPQGGDYPPGGPGPDRI